jgi:hypothetical protein
VPLKAAVVPILLGKPVSPALRIDGQKSAIPPPGRGPKPQDIFAPPALFLGEIAKGHHKNEKNLLSNLVIFLIKSGKCTGLVPGVNRFYPSL